MGEEKNMKTDEGKGKKEREENVLHGVRSTSSY